jgi:CBS domain-containing protein
MSAAKTFISGLTIAAVLDSRGPVPALVTATDDESVEAILARLDQHKILAVPVRRKETGEFRSFLSITDLCTFIAFRSYDPAHPDSTAHFVKETNLKEPLTSVIGLTEEDQSLWTFKPDEPLGKAIEFFSKGVHRALVELGAGEYTVLTQTDVVKFLYANSDKLGEVMGKTVKDLHLVQGEVKTISHTATALEGFRKMTINSLTSICILGDDEVSMLDTLSQSDLKGIKTSNLRTVLQPVMTFLRGVRRFESEVHTPTAAVGADTTLYLTIGKLLAAKLHRIWVCDGSKPIGVISLSDICCKFSPFDFKQ